MSNFSRQAGGVVVRFVFLLVIPALAGVFGLHWYVANLRYVTTDNAYVKSDIIAVSPSIGGRVTSVEVDDNQVVKRGDVLFRLDERPHRTALARANARLELIRNEVASMRAHYAQIQAEIENAEERLRYFEREQRREQELKARGMSTDAKLEAAEYQVIEAAQRRRAFEERAEQSLAELGGALDLPPEQHPKYLEALAERDDVELNLDYTTVRAPDDGIVSRMKLQPGEWVEAGEPVFSLVEQGKVWVEANLKETQLTHIRDGLPVTFEVDAYPGLEWKAQIASISSATGSEFLLLPPQNATGNWVKVVQRVPVRIEIDEYHEEYPLRAGMTVTVSVDTQREKELLTFVSEAVAAIRSN